MEYILTLTFNTEAGKKASLTITDVKDTITSDEAKEISRLKRELRDTKDVLDVLKKLSAFWENN